MFIPPDSQKVKRVKLSSQIVLLLVISGILLGIFSFYVLYDYFSVITQLQQNKELKIRNRKLAQQLQSYKIRVDDIDNTLERIKILTTKLKIISNLRDPERFPSHLKMPDNQAALEEIDDMSMKSDEELDNQFRNMQIKLRELEYKIALQEEDLSTFSEYIADQSALLASTPSIVPVKGWNTSIFGQRIDPFTNRLDHHDGLDIATRMGTHVISPSDGIVTFAGTKPGYGLMLVIDHGYGITTRYGHNSRFYVTQGMRVKRGQPISAVGNTGRSTGPHLHYEVRINGIAVDPKKFILDNPWE
jgi:murein DD-endopeptidase MepM/ murein hydrolase activator NlpD